MNMENEMGAGVYGGLEAFNLGAKTIRTRLQGHYSVVTYGLLTRE